MPRSELEFSSIFWRNELSHGIDLTTISCLVLYTVEIFLFSYIAWIYTLVLIETAMMGFLYDVSLFLNLLIYIEYDCFN